MTDANFTEKEPQQTDIEKQSTNPAWALGLVAFSIVSFIIGLFILPPKSGDCSFCRNFADREMVWKHLDEIEDWDSWDTLVISTKRKMVLQ